MSTRTTPSPPPVPTLVVVLSLFVSAGTHSSTTRRPTRRGRCRRCRLGRIRCRYGDGSTRRPACSGRCRASGIAVRSRTFKSTVVLRSLVSAYSSQLPAQTLPYSRATKKGPPVRGPFSLSIAAPSHDAASCCLRLIEPCQRDVDTSIWSVECETAVLYVGRLVLVARVIEIEEFDHRPVCDREGDELRRQEQRTLEPSSRTT